MNVIRLYCPNPDELLSASYLGAGSLIRIESSATETGVYTEVGTVALVTLTNYYTFYHTAGTVGLWYKTRYSNAIPNAYTAYSTPWQDGFQTGLCTLEAARRMVNIDSPTDTTYDGPLLKVINDVTDLIHTITGRYFLQDPPTGTQTYTWDGQWDSPYCLHVPRGVRSITSLKVRTGGSGSAQTTLGATEYAIRPVEQKRAPGEPGNRIELTDLATANFALVGNDVIEVIGTFGYAAVPPTIEGIALRTVVRAWRNRGSGFGEMGTPEMGAGFINWAMSLEDKRLLASMYNDGPRVA